MRRKNRGYALLDASLAILLGTGIVAAGVAAAIDQRGDDSARAQGLAMVTLQGAVNQYLTEHYSALVQPGGGNVAGVANPLAPTIAELRSLGALKDPFQSTAFNGGNYRIQVTAFPAGCVAPNCNLDGLVWNDRPLTDWWNNIDYPRLGVAIRAIGADGAMSNAATPNTLQGMQGKWNTANPVGAQAGILAARTGYNSASFSQFYRRDGSLPMTGDVAANGVNINNAGTVSAVNANLTGTVSATNAVATTSTVSTQTVLGSQTVGGTQQVGGALVAKGQVYLAAQGSTGSGCSGNTITTDATGLLLFCRSGVWQAAGGGIKNIAEYDWRPGYGTFSTGKSNGNWFCAISRVGGKYAGGGEDIQVYRDGGSGTWVVSGTSSSDNSGAFARISCVELG